MNKYPHRTVIKSALIWATKQGWRLCQNVVGGAWVGKLTEEYFTSGGKKPIKVIEMIHARFIKFGLLTPSAKNGKTHGGTLDLVGWRSVEITPDMVGKRIAQYCEFDAKTPGYNQLSDDQKNRVDQIRMAGGVSGIFRRGPEGIELEVLSDWKVGV